MEVIPAIDLLGGKCVRLNQGDYNKVTEFSSNPVEQAIRWQEQGASRLHLVDLDGAKTGRPVNDKIIKDISNKLNIPIQVGGGIRSSQRVKDLLDNGIEKVIVGTVAIENPVLLKALTRDYPKRIILGLDLKNGNVATSGWTKGTDIRGTDLLRSYANLDLGSIITTDISKDGTLKGPNIKELKEISESSPFDVVASGGIGSIADLISIIPLKSYGVTGTIVGRSLYDGQINLKEAIKVMKGADLQDPNKNFYA